VSHGPIVIRQHTVSFVEVVTRKDPERFRAFFNQKYERGVSFLIRRHRLDNADRCLHRIVEAAFTAVLSEEVVEEADLPRVIHHYFRLLLEESRTASGIEEDLPYTAETISGLASSLKMFKPIQIRALFKLYLKEENASSICQDLRLLPEEFRFIRTAARRVARLSAENGKASSAEKIRA
jgi:hypothetical protein